MQWLLEKSKLMTNRQLVKKIDQQADFFGNLADKMSADTSHSYVDGYLDALVWIKTQLKEKNHGKQTTKMENSSL